MDPDLDFPDRIRIFGRSGYGLKKKSGSETLVQQADYHVLHDSNPLPVRSTREPPPPLL